MQFAVVPLKLSAHEYAVVVQHAGNGRRTAAPRTQHHNDRLSEHSNTSKADPHLRHARTTSTF
jgi:hypothetical protein